nr:hypothetical protein Itr_chr06CG05490 [Ipomoea trifida]
MCTIAFTLSSVLACVASISPNSNASPTFSFEAYNTKAHLAAMETTFDMIGNE